MLKNIAITVLGLALIPVGVSANTRFVSSNANGTISIVQGTATASVLHKAALANYKKVFPGVNVGLTGGCNTGVYRAVAFDPTRRIINVAYSTTSQAEANKRAMGSQPAGMYLWREWCGRDNGSNRSQTGRLY